MSDAKVVVPIWAALQVALNGAIKQELTCVITVKADRWQ